LKSSSNIPWQGLLGLALMGAGLAWLGSRRVGAAALEPALRLGYARPAAALATSPLFTAGPQSGGLFEPLERAFKIQLSAADRLRVDFPQERELVLLESDVLPQARYGLAPRDGGWEIRVAPWRGAAWSAPSNSGAPVGPAAYPANGRIAYYDLGRIWISDLGGLRMQSLRHVPLLEQGGQLYWDYAGTRLCWMGSLSGAAAVDLGVDERGELPR
jgi:hypothetical protein